MLYQIVRYKDNIVENEEFNEIELGILFDLESDFRIKFLKKLILVHQNEISGY